MLAEVIENRNTQISGLNLFREVRGLCEYIEKPKADGELMTFPALYEGNDALKFVTSYDFRNGVCFHVMNGQITNELLDTGLRANNDLIRVTYPLQLIAIHRRSIIDDTNYTPEKLGQNLLHILRDRSINSLRATLDLNRIGVEVGSIDTDKARIDDVFQNVDIKFKHELMIVVIEYNIILEGYDNCFTQYTC